LGFGELKYSSLTSLCEFINHEIGSGAGTQFGSSPWVFSLHHIITFIFGVKLCPISDVQAPAALKQISFLSLISLDNWMALLFQAATVGQLGSRGPNGLTPATSPQPFMTT
jgi:hypothetical protein